MIVLQTFLVGAAMLGALFYFGYGVTRLFLPRAFAAFSFLFMPFTGMALVILWDYLALFLNLNLTLATWALVVFALGLNGLAYWRAREETFPRKETFRGNVSTRATRWVWLCALVAFCAAVAPLWRYGYITIIGENWDYEFYLPLADYLREFSTAQLANAPSNPLLTTILSRHLLPLPMGFSYLHATLNTLLGLDALTTFAILLGVLRALGVAAAYLFFRATLKMSERASLVATALIALNGLLLWFTYWNFGLQLASLALLPIALLFGVHALQVKTTWRAWICAGFFLGALNVTYHPALVAAGLPLGALGLYLLITDQERGRVLVRGAAIALLTLAFSFPTLWHIEDFRREYYGRAPLAIGLREFVPLSDGYGFSLQILDLAVGHTIPTAWLYEMFARGWEIAAPVLTLGAVLLSLYGLWKLRGDVERRAVWYSIVGASVLYVLIFRLPFLRPYPYGFLKSLSLVAVVLVAAMVEGGEKFSIFDFRFSIARAKLARYVVSGFAIAVTGTVVLTFALSLEQYFKPAPPFFDADALRVREVQTHVPRGAAVFVAERAEVQKIPMGLAAYALREYGLRGNVTTGYGKLENVESGKVYEYALLARGENPNARGYDSQRLWENETFALYARAAGVQYQRALDAETIAPNPLRVTIGATQIFSGTKDLQEATGARDASLIFAAFIPQRVTFESENETREIELTAGLSTLTLPQLATPTTITITPHVAQDILDSAVVTIPHDFPDVEPRLWIPYAQLRGMQSENEMQVTLSPNTILVTCRIGAARELDARCFVANPNKTELTWRWIVRGTLKGTREERVIAQREAKASPQSRIDFAATTAGGLDVMRFDDNAAVDFEPGKIPDGAYRGDLEIYDGAILLARVKLYRFEVSEKGTRMTRSAPNEGVLVIAQP